MNIIVAGLSHKTAPIEIREKLSFCEQELSTSLHSLAALPDIAEGVILSTCNRVEIIFAAPEKENALTQITHFLADHHHLSPGDIAPYLYFHTGADAVRHVFRVASSLDSMVVGEPQILGQMKDAYRSAAESKTTGYLLNRFLHKAFSVAKRVRTETNIASNAVSVSFAAVELARKIFQDLDDKKVFLLGAGEMAELVITHLSSYGAHDIVVVSRTLDRADSLATPFGGKAIGLDDLPTYLAQADIVVSSITATSFLITADQTAAALKVRKQKPMFMIDISVPRAIDPRINGQENVYLYDIDDLEGVVVANKSKRALEARKAETIIEAEQAAFSSWLQQQEVTPTIISLKEKAESIRRQELEKTLSRWRPLDHTEQERLESLTVSIVNKLLHDPITYLKNEGTKNGASIEHIRKLFNLEDREK
jgi:glutamyl-tRNA reductase